MTLDTTPDAIAGARRHTAQVLQCWRADAELSDAARLVVSELATNAIRHRTDRDDRDDRDGFTLTLALCGPALLVQVGDHDPRPPRPRRAAPDATGGRGLHIVGELSTRWGYYPVSPGGKVVWAELLADADTPPTHGAPPRVDPDQPYLPASPLPTDHCC
ncbi:ATP-binding protein [Kitasatospora sp. NPDC049285]|uniref:ATP-binding protein n=1 Tax=Kitasatospora sp. NPDC049285 TaxID=3157096 RepID=UPI0034276209